MSNESAITFPVPEVDGYKSPITETLVELVQEVMGLVQDPAVTDGQVRALFNRCIFEVAGKGDIFLPGLETHVALTVEEGDSSVTLPADFHRELFRVYSAARQAELLVMDSRVRMEQRYPDPSVGLVACAIQGRTLYLNKAVSSDDTLTIGYFRIPEKMEAWPDKPFCLPPHLIYPILVNYACRELFNRIEVDLGVPKVQTNAYAIRFAEALQELLVFAGPFASPSKEITDEVNW